MRADKTAVSIVVASVLAASVQMTAMVVSIAAEAVEVHSEVNQG